MDLMHSIFLLKKEKGKGRKEKKKVTIFMQYQNEVPL